MLHFKEVYDISVFLLQCATCQFFVINQKSKFGGGGNCYKYHGQPNKTNRTDCIKSGMSLEVKVIGTTTDLLWPHHACKLVLQNKSVMLGTIGGNRRGQQITLIQSQRIPNMNIQQL